MAGYCETIHPGECSGWGFEHVWHGCAKLPSHMMSRHQQEHECRCGMKWSTPKRMRKKKLQESS